MFYRWQQKKLETCGLKKGLYVVKFQYELCVKEYDDSWDVAGTSLKAGTFQLQN